MKKTYFKISIVMTLLLAVAVIAVLNIEGNKKHPVERYNDRVSRGDHERSGVDKVITEDTESISHSVSEIESAEHNDGESTDVTEYVPDLTEEASKEIEPYIEDSVQKMRIEFISYDVLTVHQLHEQDKYKAEDFADQELPKEDDTLIYLDRESLANESELLYKLFGPQSSEMDPNEWINLYEEHAEEVEAAKDRYSHEYVPERVYFFLKIRIYNTDTSETAETRKLNPGNLVVIMTDKEDRIITSEDISYMYNAMYTDGEEREHDLYNLDIAPGEYREVIVGMRVTFSLYEELTYEGIDTYEAYGGYVDYNLIEDGVNPVLSPDMIPLSSLPRGNFE